MPLPGSVARPIALLALAAAAAACNKDPVGTINTPAGAAIARAYVDSALAWEREVFYWADRVDWPRQQAATRARLQGLGWTRSERDSVVWKVVDASIVPWLRDAPATGPDLHSAFFWPTEAPGVVDSPVDTTRRFLVVGDTLRRAAAPGPGRIGYVWFPNFAGRNDQGRADSAQAVIRAVDQAAPCGWVLDQRFNYGGSVAAMLAGLNPLLGDAPASASQNGLGGFVFPDDSRALFYLQNGDAGIYDPSSNRRFSQTRVTSSYTLRRPGAPVAVLLSGVTASAGEFITMGFRGSGVPHRTFGEPTYGVTTVPFGTYLRPDSGYLNITAAIMFDRTGRVYGSTIAPDEAVAGPSFRTLTPGRVLAEPDAVVRAAVAWLQQQPACTGGTVARGPALDRAASPAALPGVIKPTPDLRRVSKYFLPDGARALARP